MKQGWEIKKLGEVYDVRDGTHDSPKYVKEGYPLVTSKNLKNDTLNYDNVNYVTEKDYIYINRRSKVDKGDVLFAMIGTIGNPIVIKDEPDFAIKNVALFKVPKDQDSYFLKYYLDSSIVIDKMSKDAKGATQKFVGLGYLRNFEISLPPLPEQRRIVTIIDEVFTAIAKAKANAEQNLNNAKNLFESYLQLVFENKGVDWEDKKLNDVCELIMGQSPAGETYNTTGVGVPLINGPVEFGNEPFSKTIKSKFTTDPTKYCKEGDLILCVRGSTTGRINIAGFDACIGRGVAAIRYSKNQFWINYFILSSRKKIYDLGTGATFPNVSGEILKNLIVPIPPLKAQQTIVKKLDALSAETKRLGSIYQQKMNCLDELKKSVLQKAFSGELKTSKAVVI